MKNIPKVVDATSEVVRQKTKNFVETKLGKIFLALVLIGPITFVPQLWQAWTASDIDALRTLTWPLMIIVNMSATLGVVHNGDWRMRLVMFIWVVVIAFMWLATLVR